MIDLPPEQIQCVAQAIYAESKSESMEGQRAVGHVIINRTKDKRFPSNACKVIKQPYQFTYRQGKGKLWQNALEVARNLGRDVTNGALYFRPKWNPMGRKITVRIGGHIFYK